MIKSLFIMLILSAKVSQAQHILLRKEDSIAAPYKMNIVQIASTELGSGLIVGGSKSNLYILTASHVVIHSGAIDKYINVSLFERSVKLRAKVLYAASDIDGDFALLSVKNPHFKWTKMPLVFDIAPLDKLYFVNCWTGYTLAPSFKYGRIVSFEEHDRLDIGLDEVGPGNSGSAIIVLGERTGVVGIISQNSNDDDTDIKGIGIKKIRDILTKRFPAAWQLK